MSCAPDLPATVGAVELRSSSFAVSRQVLLDHSNSSRMKAARSVSIRCFATGISRYADAAAKAAPDEFLFAVSRQVLLDPTRTPPETRRWRFYSLFRDRYFSTRSVLPRQLASGWSFYSLFRDRYFSTQYGHCRVTIVVNVSIRCFATGTSRLSRSRQSRRPPPRFLFAVSRQVLLDKHTAGEWQSLGRFLFAVSRQVLLDPSSPPITPDPSCFYSLFRDRYFSTRRQNRET